MTDVAVELRGIAKSYGPIQVLRSVDLEIARGSFTAIIGPNGAGKSTLLHIIAGLLEPSSGAVRVLGQRPNQVYGNTMGFVPQAKTLDRAFPALAIELVVTGVLRRWPWRIAAAHRERAIHALRMVGVERLANQPIRHLSGGELQRVYLARCLVREPSIIILDEPGAGLDIAGEADMYHILAHYLDHHDATVIMITHDWEGARVHASHALLIDQTVLAYGDPKEVLDEHNLLRVFGHAGHIEAFHGKNAKHA